MMIDDPLAIARLRSVSVLVDPTVFLVSPTFQRFQRLSARLSPTRG